jgi:hypothetical protein
MEGEYFFYAFYMTQGQTISKLATERRSNIAIAKIPVVTESLYGVEKIRFQSWVWQSRTLT